MGKITDIGYKTKYGKEINGLGLSMILKDLKTLCVENGIVLEDIVGIVDMHDDVIKTSNDVRINAEERTILNNMYSNRKNETRIFMFIMNNGTRLYKFDNPTEEEYRNCKLTITLDFKFVKHVDDLYKMANYYLKEALK